MNIKHSIVEKLLELIDQGLCHGAGNHRHPGDFCVQQAVNRATHGYHSDHPECVEPTVLKLGINMNDTFHGSDKERARILKRFAVAELGSAGVIDGFEFTALAKNLWNEKYPDDRIIVETGPLTSDRVEKFAEICVQALIQLGSPGAQYLYMCAPDATLKPEHKAALKKEQEIQKKLKNMTQWKGFGKEPTACAVKKGKTK